MRISDWSSDVCSSDLVDADAVIGEIDAGAGPLKRLLAAGRTGAAAELLGVGGGAMDLTIGYLKERKQFGAPIGSFQARSEEHTSELQSLMRISYAVFCLKHKTTSTKHLSVAIEQ